MRLGGGGETTPAVHARRSDGLVQPSGQDGTFGQFAVVVPCPGGCVYRRYPCKDGEYVGQDREGKGV